MCRRFIQGVGGDLGGQELTVERIQAHHRCLYQRLDGQLIHLPRDTPRRLEDSSDGILGKQVPDAGTS